MSYVSATRANNSHIHYLPSFYIISDREKKMIPSIIERTTAIMLITLWTFNTYTYKFKILPQVPLNIY